ncbi:MAG: sodium:proton exchanger [Firmicutes bacterium HGW-Firmicutes-18]|nr:MAG: sodium:proton exchanger [Firmicutes bacterium HGW-Firmicutes-18]
MILSGIFIIIGLGVLVFGANFLVKGAVELADKYGISEIIVGLTIVAFGTSTPELVVNIISALSGQSEINLGNIVGANIHNIALIIGIAGFLSPLVVDKKIIIRDTPFAIFAAVIFILAGLISSQIGRIDAIIFLACFSYFMYYLIRHALGDYRDFKASNAIANKKPMLKIIFHIISGIFLLWLGGEMTVKNSVNFAKALGIPLSLIAIIVISNGTSLPELVASIIAWKRKNSGIALGNILGSNIFNIFFVLGISGLITPLSIYKWFLIDSVIMLLLTLVFMGFIFFKKEKVLAKKEGVVFISMYFVYLIYVIVRR